jgi:hypothetical protein
VSTEPFQERKWCRYDIERIARSEANSVLAADRYHKVVVGNATAAVIGTCSICFGPVVPGSVVLNSLGKPVQGWTPPRCVQCGCVAAFPVPMLERRSGSDRAPGSSEGRDTRPAPPDLSPRQRFDRLGGA